ncbi:hypothetical protein ABZ345_38470 [Lentzea sp. NPDC005914]|uniref:hypothetical protein n=1 Tax=Lentzea sp. NPDC005914 TaxID=3154572 RepID=UPI0033C4D563
MLGLTWGRDEYRVLLATLPLRANELVSTDEIPLATDAMLEGYRFLLSRRWALVLLDNVRDMSGYAARRAVCGTAARAGCGGGTGQLPRRARLYDDLGFAKAEDVPEMLARIS